MNFPKSRGLFFVFFLVMGMIIGTCSAQSMVVKSPDKYVLKTGFFIDLGLGIQKRDKTVEWAGDQYTSWKQGSLMDFSIGYRWKHGIRFDIERANFKNDADRTKGGDLTGFLNSKGAAEDNASGYAKVESTMFNISYDFGYRKRRIAPYIGYGFGKCKVTLSDLTTPNLAQVAKNIGLPSPLVFSSTGNTVNARQIKVGANYRINDRFEVHGGYRYFQGTHFELTFPAYNSTVYPPAPIFRCWEIGVRYLF